MLTSGSASLCLFCLSRCYPNCPQVTAFQLAFVKISASCGKKIDVFTTKGAGNPTPQSSACLSKRTILYGTRSIVNPTAHEATQFYGWRLKLKPFILSHLLEKLLVSSAIFAIVSFFSILGISTFGRRVFIFLKMKNHKIIPISR